MTKHLKRDPQLRNEFILIGLLVICLNIAIVLQERYGIGIGVLPVVNAVRIVLGVVCGLIIPGYLVQTAFFPRHVALDVIERVTLSVVLSVAMIPPQILLLDSISGVNLDVPTITITQTFVILLAGLVSYFRRVAVSAQDRFLFVLNVPLSNWWQLQDPITRLLWTIFIIAVVVGGVSATAIMLLPAPAEYFTEFYVTDSNGLAEHYVRSVQAGEPIILNASVHNREGQAVTYVIEVLSTDGLLMRTDPFLLEDDAAIQREITFQLDSVGENIVVELRLLRLGVDDDADEAYRHLRLRFSTEQKKSG